MDLTPLFLFIALLYLTAGVLYFVFMMKGAHHSSGAATGVLSAAIGFHVAYLALGTEQSTTSVLGGVHGALSLSALLLSAIFLSLGRLRNRLRVLGAFIAPLALIFFIGAGTPSAVAKASASASPAILLIHLTVNIAGFVIFALASAVALGYLLQEQQLRRKHLGGIFQRLPDLEVLDTFAFRMLMIGFPLLTTGVITGTLWAVKLNPNGVTFGAPQIFGLLSWGCFGTVLLPSGGRWVARTQGRSWNDDRVSFVVRGVGCIRAAGCRHQRLMTSHILVVGLSHRTAPLELRERLAVGRDALSEQLGSVVADAELSEGMLLSTCNRVEIYGVAEDAEAATARARVWLGKQADQEDLDAFLYASQDTRAIEHAFRVTSSLDSMVVGEPQILGQVKEAYSTALARGTLRGLLQRCFAAAFSVAKKVRSQTGIAAGSVSVSSVACDLAKKIFGELEDKRVLLVGAGKMGESSARQLCKQGAHLLVINRSPQRAGVTC